MNSSMEPGPNTPVIVGVGQYVLRDTAADGPHPSPADVASRAAQAAIRDARSELLATEVDTLCAIRIFGDSYWQPDHPCGTSNNMPRSIANRLGINPANLVYGEAGGHSPQRLINEMAERIFAGDAGVCLLTGGEAKALEKLARRGSATIDWHEEVDPEFEDRGMGKTLATRHEFANGFAAPTQIYALLENAWRARQGLSREQHRRLMAGLFSRFSDIAAANPYAFFPEARSAEFLANVSRENYMVADPYTKWLVAQDAVNMGAAVLLASVAKARQLGVPEDRWVFLHGYADIDDKLVSERDDLSRSRAVALAGEVALGAAGKTIEDMRLVDLYSCFPCAVIQEAEALELDWQDPETPLTVTGGLPYCGGPGNNYSMHAIATMVDQLRKMPEDFGLVLANGGFLSKESIGIYSARQPVRWQPTSSADAQDKLDRQPVLSAAQGLDQAFSIETYTIVYTRGLPTFAHIAAKAQDGNRILAKVRSGDRQTLDELTGDEPLNRTIRIDAGEKSNYFNFASTA